MFACRQKRNDGDLIGCTGVWCVSRKGMMVIWFVAQVCGVSRKGMMVIWLVAQVCGVSAKQEWWWCDCTGVWCVCKTGMMVMWWNRCVVCQQKRNVGDLIGCTDVWCVREQARKLRWPTSPWPRVLVPQPSVSWTSDAVAAAQAFKHWISRALKISSD